MLCKYNNSHHIFKLTQINITFHKLKKELIDIPINLVGIKEIEGHSKKTLICIKDLIAYLIGWGNLVLKWNKGYENKQNVDFPETGYNGTNFIN